MISSLIEFDKWLFLLLNGWHNEMLDPVMQVISNRFAWAPLYLGLLFVVVKQFKVKSLYIIVFIVLLITLCDQLITFRTKAGKTACDV